MYDLVIAGGTVVSSAGTFVGDVGITGRRIGGMGHALAGDRVLDAAGCLVIPGGVDPHVHLQMRLGDRVSTDDFLQGTQAAILGGTTTVIDFTDPQPEETLADSLTRRRLEADGRVAADYGLHMTLPAWHMADPDSRADLAAAMTGGAATFKLYMAYPNVGLDDRALLRALQAIAQVGGRAVIHAETGPVLDELRAQALAEGRHTSITHAQTRPASLEATAVARAIAMAEIARCPLYVFHLGAEAVVDMLAYLQQRRRPVSGNARCPASEMIWAETCPHYLLLTASEHLTGPRGAQNICAPPLREKSDQDALWQGLARGAIQAVSTDHCPWGAEEKEQPDFSLVPGGVPGIEARLSLIYHHGVATGRLSIEQWVQVCCTNPALWMGFGNKGRIAPGCDADIVLFDPRQQWVVSPATLHETAGWTPYAGMAVTGRPRSVLLGGALVVQDEQLNGDDGGNFRGNYVHRSFA